MRTNDKYEKICFEFRKKLDELGAPSQDRYIIEEFSEFAKEVSKIGRNKGDSYLVDEECMDLLNACFVYLLGKGYTVETIMDYSYNKIQRNMHRLTVDPKDI